MTRYWVQSCSLPTEKVRWLCITWQSKYRLSPDPSDSSKRAITHVANTEQRVCFKEVQLKPKKATVASPGVEAPPDEEGERLKVDVMTGRTVRPGLPRGRRARNVEEEEDGAEAADKQM